MPAPSSPDEQSFWDLPTRGGHWLLVILFAGAWWTAEYDKMEWHRTIGYGIAGFLVFRVYWGVFGSSTARFKHLIHHPSVLLNYVRQLRHNEPSAAYISHNPLGSLSTIALLALLITQVGLGLFSVDVDGMEAGPLSFYISFEAARTVAELHELLFNGLLFLIALHVLAVIFYWLVRGQNLMMRMIHGRGPQPSRGETRWFAPVWRLCVGIAMAATVMWYLNSLDVPL